jgi:hypothetical protein
MSVDFQHLLALRDERRAACPHRRHIRGSLEKKPTSRLSVGASSLVPIGPARIDVRYRQANERDRDDGQDDVAHTSLLKEKQSQPPSVLRVKFP